MWVLARKKRTASDDRLNRLIMNKRQELNEYVQIKIKYQLHLDGFINKFNLVGSLDRTESLNLISKTAEEYARIKSELNGIDAELKVFEAEKEGLFSVSYSDLNINDLKRELNCVQDEYRRKANELANIRSSIRRHIELADTYQDLEAKKAEIAEKIERYTDDYQMLLKTAEYLKLADENLKILDAPKLLWQ